MKNERDRGTLKSFSHLLALGRTPTEYEVTSSRLLYHPERRFALNLPLSDWYRQHLDGSGLEAEDWEAFRDPRETTYAKYVQLQHDRQRIVDGLLERIELEGYDRELSEQSIDFLSRAIFPLRYPLHGLQMVAAYVGQMAPSGKIAIAALLQASDEMRRIQRIAYRMAQCTVAHPERAWDSKARWQEAPEWQPLRELIERMLVTYDWAEALVALNLCTKDLLDPLLMIHLPARARHQGDHLLDGVFFSLMEDCRWHQDWSRALVDLALAQRPINQTVLRAWIDRWLPLARSAVGTLAPVLANPSEIERWRLISRTEQSDDGADTRSAETRGRRA